MTKSWGLGLWRTHTCGAHAVISSLAPPSDHYVQMHSLSFKWLRGHLTPLVALVVNKNGPALLVLKRLKATCKKNCLCFSCPISTGDKSSWKKIEERNFKRKKYIFNIFIKFTGVSHLTKQVTSWLLDFHCSGMI